MNFSLKEWFNLSVEEKYILQNVKRFENNEEYKSVFNMIDYYYSIIDCLDLTTTIYEYNIFSKSKKKLKISNKPIRFYCMLNNLKSVLLSLKSCLKLLNLADSYLLLRKFRDDFLIMLYVESLTYNYIDDTQQEKALRWLSEIGAKYEYKNIIKKLENYNNLKEFMISFDIKNLFNLSGEKFNDYAHSNGIEFFNKLTYSSDDKVSNLSKLFLKEMRRVINPLIALLILSDGELFRGINYKYYDVTSATNSDEELKYEPANLFVNFVNKELKNYNSDMTNYIKKHSKMHF